jgi:hypothetical protein
MASLCVSSSYRLARSSASSNKTEKTVVIIITDNAFDYGSDHMNSVIRCSSSIQLGDTDIVRPCPDTKYHNRLYCKVLYRFKMLKRLCHFLQLS